MLFRSSEDFKEKVYKAFEIEKEYLRVKKEFEENEKYIPELTKELETLKSNFRYAENSTKEVKTELKNINDKYEILLSKSPGTNDEVVLMSTKIATLKPTGGVASMNPFGLQGKVVVLSVRGKNAKVMLK